MNTNVINSCLDKELHKLINVQLTGEDLYNMFRQCYGLRHNNVLDYLNEHMKDLMVIIENCNNPNHYVVTKK